MSQQLQAFEDKVNQAQTVPDKVDALNTLAERLADLDTQRSLEVAQEAYELARLNAYQTGIVTSLLNQAWSYHVIGDYAASVTKVLPALKLAREHDLLQAEVDGLNILGNNHNVVGNHADALECFTKALLLSDRVTNQKNKAVILNNIGLIYRAQNDYAQALWHFQQAMEVYRAVGAQGILPGHSMLNIAQSYNALGNYVAAIEWAEKSLQIFQAEQYAIGKGYAFLYLSDAYQHTGNQAESMRLYQQALEHIRTTNAKLYEGEIEQEIGRNLIEQGEAQAALAYLERALALFQSLETKPELFATHELLAQAYKQLGDFTKAFAHLETFQKIKQEVFNAQADSRQKTLQAVYEVERARLEAESHYQRVTALQREIRLSEQIIADLDAYADNVAHDLRNPIGVIVAYANLLNMNLEGSADTDSQAYLNALTEAAEKMDQIVEALLTLAKARKEEIMPQVVNMSDVMEEARKRSTPLAEKHHATIRIIEPLPEVLGHPSWLEEVCVNYMSNAIKYGGAPPTVTIRATRTNNFIQYAFQDNGPGLSPSEVEKLFIRFERLGKQKIEGHGLGLIIAKTVIEKLGGQVGVSSSGVEGDGCQFSFTLRSPEKPSRDDPE